MSICNVIAVASNIRDGDNPAFTVTDFLALMPCFGNDIVPQAVVEQYLAMAHEVVKEARWGALWKEGMRLYVSHFLQKYLQTVPDSGASRAEVVNAGKVQGSMTSKSVGGVSVSYDNGQATNDLMGWADWKTTEYGVQYATLARMVCKGGMYVR